MTMNKLCSIKDEMVKLNDQMIVLKKQYVEEYCNLNPGRFGRIIAEVRADNLFLPEWEKKMLGVTWD